MMIDSNMIKVLWIEDDLKVYKAFRGTASLYNIDFIHADNWIDGKQFLKEQFNEISAIILDAQCKWDKNSIAEDKFLNEVMSELWELFGEVRKTIPWYILSAGTMNDYAKVIANANNRKRQSYDNEWGPVSWAKPAVIPQIMNNPLLNQILEVAKKQIQNIILSRHKETFKYLGTEGNLCNGSRTIMLKAFSALYAPEENIGFEFQGNPIRKVLEHMLRHANKLGIIPDEFIDDRNNPKVTDCKNFLIGEIPNYVKIQLWDPEKNEAFAIFPKPLSHYLQNVLNYVNSCSHSEEDEDIPYIINSDEKDLFFAMILHLSHLIAHYGKFVDSHRDVESNKKLSRIIPVNNTETTSASDNNNMIDYHVEGPIYIDCQGNPYIKDVLLKESYKHNANQIYHTRKVYPNTGRTKDKYKYYAPKVFK